MSDASLTLGNVLQIAANGDLLMSTGPQLTQDRVIRRLLSNPGTYLWFLSYGGGLARFIGKPNQPNAVSADVAAQMALESSVASSPTPTGNVVTDQTGVTTLTVTYTDATTGLPTTLQQPVP